MSDYFYDRVFHGCYFKIKDKEDCLELGMKDVENDFLDDYRNMAHYTKNQISEEYTIKGEHCDFGICSKYCSSLLDQEVVDMSEHIYRIRFNNNDKYKSLIYDSNKKINYSDMYGEVIVVKDLGDKYLHEVSGMLLYKSDCVIIGEKDTTKNTEFAYDGRNNSELFQFCIDNDIPFTRLYEDEVEDDKTLPSSDEFEYDGENILELLQFCIEHNIPFERRHNDEVFIDGEKLNAGYFVRKLVKIEKCEN